MLSLLGASFALAVEHYQFEPILEQSSAIGDKGQYAYDYSSPIETKREVRDPTGLTEGSYSYLDQNGVVQHLRYSAGRDGFKVLSTNLLLRGVVDTPEVEEAKRLHEAAVAEARAALPVLKETPVAQQIATEEESVIADTPEVATAKAQHLAAHKAAEAALPKLPREERVYIPAQPIYPHPGVQPIIQPQYPGIQSQYPVVQQPIYLQPGFISGRSAEDIPRSEFGETPEVALARKEHLAAHAQAKALLPTVPQHFIASSTPSGVDPGFLQDTPDVLIAKARHAAAVAQARALRG